jgi:transposase InsO family protein
MERAITYIATDEGWLFLAVVIDLFSRQMVGWSLREDMRQSRRRQLRNRQLQPLHAVPAEVDLRSCVVTNTFERDDHAFAELVVEYALA